MFTFLDLQTEVKRRATRNESGTTFDTAIDNLINTSLFRIARESNWRTLRRKTTFVTVASQEAYNLPPQVSNRFFLWHEEYGYPYLLNYMPEQEFIGMGIDKDTTGTSTHYRMWESDMVLTQPSAASVVAISSSSAADTSIATSVFGIVAGYPDSEIITTNAADGTTVVSGSKSFTSIDRFVKSATSTGRITATTNAAAVTVAVIPTGDVTAGILYRKVKLYPVSSSVDTISVSYYKDPYRLVGDGDVHELGQEFDEAIILLATAKLNYETNKDEGDKFFALYTDEIKSLKRTNVDKIDWFPKLSSGHGSRVDGLLHPYLSYSQIGSSYGPRG